MLQLIGRAPTHPGELGPVVSRRTPILPAVAIPVATRSGCAAFVCGLTHGSRTWGTSSALVCSGDDLVGEMQPSRWTFRRRWSIFVSGPTTVHDGRVTNAPFTEVVDTLGGEGIVVVLPRKLGLDETLGGQALQGLDDLEVGNIKFLVFGSIVVLFGDEDAL